MDGYLTLKGDIRAVYGGKKRKLHCDHPLQIIFIRVYVFQPVPNTVFPNPYGPGKFEQATGCTAALIKLTA